MTLNEIAQYRLINQQIAGTKLQSAVEMVQWFGAVQAQEYAQAKWGLGLRLPFTCDKDIEKNFTAGEILRTHLLRPTWHFVTAADIHWLLMLTASRVNAANAYMYRKLELDKNIFTRCNHILTKTLQGGKQLTRDTINEAFKKNKIEASGHRLSYIMMQAELAGLICSGARQGNQFTYALLDERVPKPVLKNEEEALAELTKRYFKSRGPATLKDFSTWSGLTLTTCRKGIELVESCFEKTSIGKDEYFFPGSRLFNKKAAPSLYFLPIYDELIMGYKDRSAMFCFKNSIPASKFSYDCVIIYDGQVIGTWKRVITQKSIELSFDFFKPLNKVQNKAFDKTIHRLSEFSNLAVSHSKIKQ